MKGGWNGFINQFLSWKLVGGPPGPPYMLHLEVSLSMAQSVVLSSLQGEREKRKQGPGSCIWSSLTWLFESSYTVRIGSSALSKSQEHRFPFVLIKICFCDLCQMHSLDHIWASHVSQNERFAWLCAQSQRFPELSNHSVRITERH